MYPLNGKRRIFVAGGGYAGWLLLRGCQDSVQAGRAVIFASCAILLVGVMGRMGRIGLICLIGPIFRSAPMLLLMMPCFRNAALPHDRKAEGEQQYHCDKTDQHADTRKALGDAFLNARKVGHTNHKTPMLITCE